MESLILPGICAVLLFAMYLISRLVLKSKTGPSAWHYAGVTACFCLIVIAAI